MVENWKEWIPGKTGPEVLRAIGECIKQKKWPDNKIKEYSNKVWKLHKEINEDPQIEERKKILDRLF